MAMLLRDAKQYDGTGPSSKVHRIKLAIKPIKAMYAQQPAVDFGPQHFKAVRQKLIDGCGARTTINDHMKRIVSMFKWAATEGIQSEAAFEFSVGALVDAAEVSWRPNDPGC